MIQWLAYTLITVSLAAAVLLRGGVYPSQWEWSALGVALAAVLYLFCPKQERDPGKSWGLIVLALLFGWMVFQLIPLPASWIAHLSPLHGRAVHYARATTGTGLARWVSLSLAPALTLERLLYVVPAMAAFVVARDLAWWWRDRLWLVLAPVVVVAWLESILGLVQFYFMRMAGGDAGSAVGTYVNRNHFAGLLELALPLAAACAVVSWKHSGTPEHAPSTQTNTGRQGERRDQGLGVALRTAALISITICLLAGVVLSLSRMGFISTLVAAGFSLLLVMAAQRSHPLGARRTWRERLRWLIVPAVPMAFLGFILIFVPTRELLERFADMPETEDLSKDTRMQIWRDTRHLAANYQWTGVGLGAYERGLYAYKTAAPVNTVDFAHNDYLQILSELGIPGAVLTALLAGWIAWRALSAVLWSRGLTNWEYAVGVTGGLLALALHGLTDFNFYIPANALAFAWLGGVAVSSALRKG